ncbi:hypothetical protein [Pelagovum pacificum]|uniref:Uncharacterized protein n=1 Tax=Pelagovum pacificum TaxID=2588711 RepID=A0A5C5GGL6_9RHOB|nr:hypothetical protein [Pelagovum pacificum]TNY33882.1 hypothetical protein FHY64_11645 [Pelagovum pacificum]
MAPEETGYLVTLDDGLEIDVAGVFDRIPRTRIEDLEAEANRLRIVSTCVCRVEAFLWQPDRLVVDVIDGLPQEPEGTEEVVEDIATDVVRLPLVTERSPSPPSPLMPDAFVARAENDERLSDAESALLRNVARAAGQGLLALSVDPIQDRPDDEPDEPVEVAAPPTIVQRPGIAAHTSIDRDLADIDLGQELLGDIDCLPSEFFAMREWGGDAPFGPAISGRRDSILRDSGEIDEDAVMELAQGYLAYGFGAEASWVLAQLDRGGRRIGSLRAIAAVLNGQVAPEILNGQLHCDNDAALWTLLGTSAGSEIQIDSRTLLVSFERLPSPVKQLIAPRLVARFLEMDDKDSATIVGRSIGIEEDPSPEAMVSSIELESALGGQDNSLDAVLDLLADTQQADPALVLRAFELAHQQDRHLPPEIMDLAETLQFQHRDSATAQDLLRARVIAELDLGHYDKAAAIAVREGDDIELNSTAYGALAASAPDGVFLDVVLGEHVPQLRPAVENEIAERLLSLGLADAAEERLIATPSGHDARDRRYLRARAALMQGDVDRVRELLVGLTDEQAENLRRRAAIEAGDFETALSDAGAQPDEPTAPELAWRAGNWNRLASSPDVQLRERADVMLASDTRPLTDVLEEPSLREGRDALSRAGSSRDSIASMLDRFSLPEQTE